MAMEDETNRATQTARHRRLPLATLAALGLPLVAGCLPQPGPNLNATDVIYRVVYTPDGAGATVSVEQVSTTTPPTAPPLVPTTAVPVPTTGPPIVDGAHLPISDGPGEPEWYAEDVDAYAAWSGNGYSHAQLEALAEEWSVTEQEAMLQGGRAILTGNTTDVDSIVADVIPDEHDEPWNDIDHYAYSAWWEAGYNYPELDVLAAEWGLNQYDAKARAGWAILAGDTSGFESLIESVVSAEQITTTTQPTVVYGSLPLADGPAEPAEPLWYEDDVDVYAAWSGNGYNHAQLEALAEEWRVTEQDAMSRAGRAILRDDTSDIDSIVADVRPDENAEPWNDLDDPAYDAWRNSGYHYTDLDVLAAEWGVSFYDAKARAGWAVLANKTSSFDSIIGHPIEPFWTAGFTYENALALANEWNVAVIEAKVTAAKMITTGRQSEIEQLLADA